MPGPRCTSPKLLASGEVERREYGDGVTTRSRTFTVGEMFIILLATRRALPRDVYELAAIEDATGWDVFRRVTLPLMAPVLGLLVLRDIIQSFQFSFVPALVVTEGGPPPYATTYLPLFVYRNAFEYLRYGYAAAATIVMMALTLLAVGLQWRLVRRYRGLYER